MMDGSVSYSKSLFIQICLQCLLPCFPCSLTGPTAYRVSDYSLGLMKLLIMNKLIIYLTLLKLKYSIQVIHQAVPNNDMNQLKHIEKIKVRNWDVNCCLYTGVCIEKGNLNKKFQFSYILRKKNSV